MPSLVSNPFLNVVITNIDTNNTLIITPAVVNVDIYMNMGKPTTGNIFVEEELLTEKESAEIKDSMINHLPIVGREFVVISFQEGVDSNEVFSHGYAVYSIDNIVFEKDRSGFVIRFADPLAIANPGIRISKKYKGNVGTTIDSIFNGIKNNVSSSMATMMEFCYGGQGIQTDIRSTTNEYNFLVPFWSPLKTISWFTSFAQSGAADAGGLKCADCVFFQDKNGVWKLKSFSDIFVSGNAKKLSWIVQQTDKDNPALTQENAIVNINVNQLFNTQEYALSGLAGQRLFFEDYRKMEAKYINMNITSFEQMVRNSYTMGVNHEFGYQHALNFNNNTVFKHLPTNINEPISDDVLNKVLIPKYIYGEALHSYMRIFQCSFNIDHYYDISVGDCLDLTDLSFNGVGDDSSLPIEVIKTYWGVDAIHISVSPSLLEATVHCFSPSLNVRGQSKQTTNILSGAEAADRISASQSGLWDSMYRE